MKLGNEMIAIATLAMSSGSAAAASGSLNEFVPKVLPVLVQVDSRGNVTSMSPAAQLSPKLNQLLRSNLDEMINSPAIDNRGRPKSSQFILNLAVQTSPRPDGDYDMNFAYVSTAPVPSGSWYWVHVDGHRLALASQDARNRGERSFNRYDRPSFQGNDMRPPMPGNSMRTSAPATQASRPVNPR